jgi:hypothetical protein
MPSLSAWLIAWVPFVCAFPTHATAMRSALHARIRKAFFKCGDDVMDRRNRGVGAVKPWRDGDR